ARPDGGAGLGAGRGELLRFAAADVDDPKLPVAAARRFEEDALTVGRPARVAILFLGRGELPRRGGPIRRSEPEVGLRLVGGRVGDRGHRVDDPFAIRAYLRVGDALEFEQVVDR